MTGIKELGYRNMATRRGDGFGEAVDGATANGGGDGPAVSNGGDEKRVEVETEDPGHKYESIPLDGGGEEEAAAVCPLHRPIGDGRLRRGGRQ